MVPAYWHQDKFSWCQNKEPIIDIVMLVPIIGFSTNVCLGPKTMYCTPDSHQNKEPIIDIVMLMPIIGFSTVCLGPKTMYCTP